MSTTDDSKSHDSDNEDNSTKRRKMQEPTEEEIKKYGTPEKGYECKYILIKMLITADLDHTADIQFHSCKSNNTFKLLKNAKGHQHSKKHLSKLSFACLDILQI
jgi:hypothetical protein